MAVTGWNSQDNNGKQTVSFDKTIKGGGPALAHANKLEHPSTSSCNSLCHTWLMCWPTATHGSCAGLLTTITLTIVTPTTSTMMMTIIIMGYYDDNNR